MKRSEKYTILAALTLSAILYPINQLIAQKTHNVAVSNNKFEPVNLTIANGDIVKWTNNEGTHSVDGTKATYSSNPVSFSNSSGGPGWTFSFTFNTDGTYDYECGVHGSSMKGKITVGNTTGIDDNTTELKLINAFPNPTNRTLNIPISEQSKENTHTLILTIFSLSGSKIKQEYLDFNNNLQINIEDLGKGIYFYKLTSENRVLAKDKFVKTE